MPKTVTIFGASGGSGARRGTAAYDEARRLGRLLAQAGYTICNGGYSGTMEASARGAVEAGGQAIGVTLALFDPAPGNRYTTDERKAPDFFARLHTLITTADAYVCLRGGVGTLTELNLTWTLLQTRAIERRPFLCVGPAWRAILDAYRGHALVRDKDFRLITLVDTVEQAAEWLTAHLG